MKVRRRFVVDESKTLTVNMMTGKEKIPSPYRDTNLTKVVKTGTVQVEEVKSTQVNDYQGVIDDREGLCTV